MSVLAQLEAPLPGGSTGATVRLHPLLTGEMLAPRALLARRGGPLHNLTAIGVGLPRSRRIWIPAPAFLVEHPGAGPFLVDTGLHPSVARDPRESMGRLGARLYDYRMSPDQSVRAQAQARGIDPEDIGLVLMTHLHLDHASGALDLPGATFAVDAREWPAANARTAALNGYRAAQLEGLTWRAFPETDGQPLDLFGDGSVSIVSTPGHSPGHCSVLLRLAGRDALLCGDAAYTRDTIEHGTLPGLTHDTTAFKRSLAWIQSFASEHPDAVLIPGHYPDAWPGLDPVYG